MKKGIIFIAIVGVCWMTTRCSAPKKDDEKVCMNPDSVNPNGSSELALMMRSMAKHAEGIRNAIQEGTAFPTMPTEFNRLKEAKATKENMSGDVFNTYADNYLKVLNDFYAADRSKQHDAYDNILTACVSCHNNFCQGPIKKIESLRIYK